MTDKEGDMVRYNPSVFFVTSSSRRVAGIGNLIVGWILPVIYSTMANATDSYFVHEIIWQI